MSISVLLSTVADIVPERIAVSDSVRTLTYAQLLEKAQAIAAHIRDGGYECVSFVATNSAAMPAALFAAAEAGIPFAPLNYRLADDQLTRQVDRLGKVLVVADAAGAARISGCTAATVVSEEELFELSGAEQNSLESSEIAVLLFTSGTTGEPKIVELKHENLSAYILDTVELLSAPEGDAGLVSVPPYHIAGVAAVLSSVFSTRRIVYLDAFSAEAWVTAVRDFNISNAMVVPTMLQRILELLEESGETLPQLRALSYGGGRMPIELIREALEALPHVGFTNAYGLTETSSTIALLGPQDHREAAASEDEAVRARLGSVGRPIPAIELQIRGEDNAVLAAGELGEIWVRGPQISGSYRGSGSQLIDGWFCTKDNGMLDAGGFLFLNGRADDVIVRGGENISPGEIEDVLRTHQAVVDAAVVAAPDAQWGEVPVAVIVLAPGAEADADELKSLVRGQLRSSRVPAEVLVWDELPYNEMGKMLRKDVKAQIVSTLSAE